jgi:hypothetical protein
MGKYVSDGERLAIAMLNNKETELKQTREELSRLHSQLRAMSGYITELKLSNKQLCAQVNYLVSKKN